MAHQHRAVPAKQTISGWNCCVTPDKCAADPKRQAAHGSITHLDVCSCGYIRKTEANMTAVNFGPWQEPGE